MVDQADPKKIEPAGSLFAVNESAAQAFSEIADLLEIKGENPFKIKAYIKASRVLRDLEQDLEELAATGDLTSIPGVGKAIADKLEAFLQTGTIPQLEELREEIPPGLVEIAALPGLGAKKTAQLHAELGVVDLSTLREALESGRVEKLKGFSKASQTKLLAAAERAVSVAPAFVKSRLEEWSSQTVERLGGLHGLRSVHVVGTVRRLCPQGERLDLLLLCDDLEGAGKALRDRLQSSGTEHQEGQGQVSLVHPAGCPIYLHLRAAARPGWELIALTGPEVFVKEAEKRLKGSSDAAEEQELFAQAGLAWIPPELRHREDCWELDQEALLRPGDVAGNLHCHTTHSDGLNSMEEMARQAQKLGHKFFGVSDHSRSLVVANGLTPDRLLAQIESVRGLQPEFPNLKILASSEVDILEDGELDYKNDLLDRLDYAVVAVHSFFHLTREQMTQRLLKGVSHPKARILAHPTGRLLTRRDGYDADWEQVFARCAELGVAVELNSSPWRLDLPEHLLEQAVTQGCLVAVNTDAHSLDEFEYVRHGVDMARRAGVPRERVVNSWDTERLLSWFANALQGVGAR